MSRRDKEIEIQEEQSQQAESRGVGRRNFRFALSESSILINLLKEIRKTKDDESASAIISCTLDYALKNAYIKFDSEGLKIPWSVLGTSNFEPQFDNETVDKMTNGRGRPFMKRLMDKITDNQVVNYFKKAQTEVKEKASKLCESMKQFSVCFFKGLFKSFSPMTPTYGKLSHYHRIMEKEVEDFPSRRMLDYYYNWFESWKPSVTDKYMEKKQINEKKKHRLWEKLIDWIYNYLCKTAPQYAVLT